MDGHTLCPTCGKTIKDEDEHIWWLFNKEYCSEACVRAINGMRAVGWQRRR